MEQIYYTKQVNGNTVPGTYTEVSGVTNNIDLSDITIVTKENYDAAVVAYKAVQEQKEQERAAALEQALTEQEADLSPKRQNVLNGLNSTNMTSDQVNEFAELFGWEERV